jgi:hypothetical protein
MLRFRTAVLDKKSITDDEDVIMYFTQGQCHALAWELHKLKGWMPGIISDDYFGTPDYMGHAFVVNDKGMAVDITGEQTIEDFRADWPYLHHMHICRSTAEYKKEMLMWVSDTKYNKDPEAKLWAQYIVDKLGSQFS